MGQVLLLGKLLMTEVEPNSGHWSSIYEYNGATHIYSWYQFFRTVEKWRLDSGVFLSQYLQTGQDIAHIFYNENGNNSGHVRLLSVAKLDSYQYTWNVSWTLYDGDYQQLLQELT